MAWLNRLRRRIRALARKEEMDREMDEEMRFHVEMEAEELVRTRGLSPEEARRQAMRDFGRVEGFREEGRDARGVRVLEELLADLRFAARMCSKHAGFAAATVLTLALGIGASTAVFSVVYGVLLKPLPFQEPDRLVSLLHRAPALDLDEVNQGPATWFTYLDNQRAFEALGAWEANEASITGGGDPEQVEVLTVSHSTLPLLRVQPLAGRLFRAEDDAPGSPPQAILTHGFWQRRFGGDRSVVGQVLQVDGVPTQVVGVLPASFRFLDEDPAVLLPMALDRAQADGVEFDFQVLARLKPGVTLPQASADVGRMIPLLPPEFDVLQLRPYVRPLADDVIGDVGQVLWILLAAVGVVLLIACGNVAGLFLIRAEGRQQELSMRAALGASRGRIARALLSESILLAVCGGALGLVLAQAALGLLRRIAPAELPRVEEIAIDPAVLLFTLAVSVLSGALFGLFTVLRFGAPNVAALREGGRSASDGPARHRARNALVVLQVALALMLMVASGLMIRTFVAMRQVHPGFARPEQVQTFRLAVPASLVEDSAQAARAHQRVAERLAQVPGVRSVGVASSITMDGEDNTNPLYVEDFPVAEGVLPPLRRFKSFAPGFFETMGNPVVAGRSVTWDEVHGARPVAVVSETLAREYWGEPARALGRRVRGTGGEGGRWYEIVGVVGEERDDGLNHAPTPIVYWPLLNDVYPRRTLSYAVRSDRVAAPGFLGELRQAVWSVDPRLPLAAVQTLDEIQARSMARTAFAMVMLAIAAGVALLLSAVGIYGVVAYVAAQRTREIGIRMALGAQIGQVRKMFLRHGLRLTAVGIGLGIGAALALTRVMSTLLFGVRSMDPLSYAAVSALLAAVALLATYLPARRATRVDPMIAVRADA
ncbi:MAG: ABC transporter permease [Gemmatimonadota bacterium]